MSIIDKDVLTFVGSVLLNVSNLLSRTDRDLLLCSIGQGSDGPEEASDQTLNRIIG